MTRSLHIVFAGGGTAGHLFPGLAVAAALRSLEPRVRLTFVGTGRAFEADAVRAAGYEYLALPARPWPARARDALTFLSGNVLGYFAARRYLCQSAAGAVVGLGGYASVPTARAACDLRVPLVLLEQNVVPGRATRWLSRRAALVCAALPAVRSQLEARVPLEVTGNPLRAGFAAASAGRCRTPDRPQLLVLGGSGGAQTLNEQAPRAIYKAGDVLAGWDIVHQTGPRDSAATAELYARLGLAAQVTPFIKDMPGVLAATDLAISRAGGTTLAELAVCGVPAILLPFPRATFDHQRQNAEVFQAAGAAQLLDERQVAGRLDNELAGQVRLLAADPGARHHMAARMQRFARPAAAFTVAEAVLLQAERAASAHRAKAAGPAGRVA